MGFFGGGGSSVNLASPPAIGSTTPNTGAFTTLSANNGTLTSSSPAFTLAQTWNSAGVVFTALQANVTDTASNASSLLIDFKIGSNSYFSVNKQGGIFVPKTNINLSGLYFGNTNNGISNLSSGRMLFLMDANSVAILGYGGASSTFPGFYVRDTNSIGFLDGNYNNNADVILFRDGAGALAQRNTTNAQTFRLYNTFTDASNYERGFFRWSSNVLEIGAEAAGTGTQRQLRLPLGTVTVSTPLSITQTWNSSGVTFSGFVVNFTDTASSNSSLVFDFQKNGASLFKMDKFGNFTSGSWVFSSTNSTFGDWNAAYGWSSGSQLTHNSSNRNLRLVFGGSATMLEFGGATSSFPALKRSSAILQIRLADDTGYTTLDAQLRLQGTAPATAGATGTAGDVRYDSDYIYICTAANTWKRVAIATWP
jgi:hypothetical protein